MEPERISRSACLVAGVLGYSGGRFAFCLWSLAPVRMSKGCPRRRYSWIISCWATRIFHASVPPDSSGVSMPTEGDMQGHISTGGVLPPGSDVTAYVLCGGLLRRRNSGTGESRPSLAVEDSGRRYLAPEPGPPETFPKWPGCGRLDVARNIARADLLTPMSSIHNS